MTGYTYGNVDKALLCCQVQRGVALVVEVRVLQPVRVVANDPLDQREIIQHYGAAKAPGDINPASYISTNVWSEPVVDLHRGPSNMTSNAG